MVVGWWSHTQSRVLLGGGQWLSLLLAVVAWRRWGLSVVFDLLWRLCTFGRVVALFLFGYPALSVVVCSCYRIMEFFHDPVVVVLPVINIMSFSYLVVVVVPSSYQCRVVCGSILVVPVVSRLCLSRL